MNSIKKYFLLGLSLFLFFYTFEASAYSDKIYKHLEKFARILDIIDKSYVTEPDEEKLVTGAIKGMLFSLDPHTIYFSSETYKDFKSDTKGRFGGVGLEVSLQDGFVTVVAPIEGTPAARAGLQSGDRIIGINDRVSKGMDLNEAVHLMRGPVGSKVTLTIWKKGMKQPRQVVLVREVVKVASVTSEPVGDGLGLFRITSFQDNCAAALKKSINSFRKEHGEIQGLILDLRDNPGGLLSEAVKVVDLFQEEGVIVSTRGRKEVQEIKKARRAGTLPHFPVVVMINNGSASASEIVAGALQDTNRAKIVGTKSYGKGSVQTVINLDDGDALKITIARYFTPKNRMIDGKGIFPDVQLGKKEYEKYRRTNKVAAKASTDEYRNFQKNEAIRILKGL